MPIFVTIRRVGLCCICNGQFDLQAEEKAPERCVLCGSGDWEFGPESSESRFIRQGITRTRRALNPGATSKKRVDHGKRQYRQFKPKPIENSVQEGEN